MKSYWWRRRGTAAMVAILIRAVLRTSRRANFDC
jgi:hypothetical protein